MRRWIFASILGLLGWDATANAELPSRSESDGCGFTVCADSIAISDIVALEAERIHREFHRRFGLVSRPSAVPIILVAGEPFEWKDGDEGVVRVFPKLPHWKIQVNWGRTPLVPSAFQRGCVRAFCVRLALEALASEAPSKKQRTDLRVPFWMTEGIAGLLGEEGLAQEIQGRATLMARLEPTLPLGDVLRELEGKSAFTPSQRALAAVLCRGLTDSPAIRQKFFKHLSWEPSMKAREWLASLLESRDPEAWWREVWNAQAGQFSWVKLGFVQTLEQVQAWEAGIHADSGAPSQPPRLQPSEIGTMGHPWFCSWSQSFSESEDSAKEKLPKSKEIEIRRALALEWLSEQASSQTPLTREDWLAWDRIHAAEADGATSGPVGSWFARLTP